MKKFRNGAYIALIIIASLFSSEANAEDLVILHTNDTHSQIEPSDNGFGGISRRKSLIDSVRSVRKNVVLIDAGDMMQGTLYFTLYGGEVETKLMNLLGYDIQILGNHEFDNGIESLYKVFSSLKASKLSTNYDFTTTPLASIFEPFLIKEYGGRKIGFIAVNLNPKGIISDRQSEGVVYLDGIKAANSTAWYLKNIQKVDVVIAISHIGYYSDTLISDVKLAKESEDIDLIIGGHSHTKIDPADEKSVAWLVDNAAGRPVLVAQTGSRGANVGEIVIDLDSFEKNYRLLPVDARYDKIPQPGIDSILQPYRKGVDEFRNFRIGKTDGMKKSDWTLVNWMADFVFAYSAGIIPENIDLSIVNKGGIRADMKKGYVTKGTIMQIFPFENKIEVMKISGEKLKDAFDIMASRGGDGVSHGVDIKFNPEDGKCTSIIINGEPIVPDRYYNVATLDYLARGGDYMSPLKDGEIIGSSDNILYNDIINSLIDKKIALSVDRQVRMQPVK